MNSGIVLHRKKPGLYLSGPISELGNRQNRSTCQMELEFKLVKILVVEAAKFRGQAAERPDKLELCGEKVNNESELHLLSKCKTVFGLTLNLRKRVSHCQKVRD